MFLKGEEEEDSLPNPWQKRGLGSSPRFDFEEYTGAGESEAKLKMKMEAISGGFIRKSELKIESRSEKRERERKGMEEKRETLQLAKLLGF